MDKITQFFLHHWLQWLLLFFVIGLILINELLAQRNRPKALSPHALVHLINTDNDLVILDLRDLPSYQKGHIINAIHAAPSDIEEQRLDKYKMKELIVIDAQGLQAASLAMKLEKQGFTRVKLLAGGINAWQNANLPLIKEKGQ